MAELAYALDIGVVTAVRDWEEDLDVSDKKGNRG